MANQAAKKRKAENEAIVARLRKLILIVNLIYILIRVGWMWDSFGFWNMFGFSLICVTNYFLYSWIAALAQPTYENGELVDGGHDLNMKGHLSEYYFDIIYIAAFVQIATIFSDWFWLTFLVIPAYAVYYLWDWMAPFLASKFTRSEGSTDVMGANRAERRRKEREDRKAAKVKGKVKAKH
jgi:hypothetical protein